MPCRQRALAQQTCGPNPVVGRRTRDAMPAPAVARRSSCFVYVIWVCRCGFVYLFGTFSRAYRRRCRRVRPRVWADPTCSDPVARADPLPVNDLFSSLDKFASGFFFLFRLNLYLEILTHLHTFTAFVRSFRHPPAPYRVRTVIMIVGSRRRKFAGPALLLLLVLALVGNVTGWSSIDV